MTLPPAPPNVRLVASFAELLATPFQGNVNAICWARTLPGDFAEVVAGLAVHDGLTTIDEALLAALPLGPAGRLAIATLLADLRLLRAAGHEPALDLVAAYPRDADEDLPTDVLSFHVDSATVPTDTFLCTYSGAPSEGLHHEQARRRTEDPRLRARLLAKFGGADGP